MIPQYDSTLRYNQDKYQLGRMLGVLRVRGIGPPLNSSPTCANSSGYEVFIGYLILDALIGNTDRHHDNWGVLVTSEDGKFRYHLAPTFDHASSLGRELSREASLRRLETADPRGSVEAYAANCAKSTRVSMSFALQPLPNKYRLLKWMVASIHRIRNTKKTKNAGPAPPGRFAKYLGKLWTQ